MKPRYPGTDNEEIKRWRTASGEKRLALRVVADALLSVTSRSEKVKQEALESIDSKIFHYWCGLAGIEVKSLKRILSDPIRRAEMRRNLEELLEDGEEL